MAFLDWDATAFPQPRLRKPGAKPSALSLAQIAAGLPVEEVLLEDVREEAALAVPESPRVEFPNISQVFPASQTTNVRFGPFPFPFILKQFGWRTPSLGFQDLVVRLIAKRDTSIELGAFADGQIFPGTSSNSSDYRISGDNGHLELFVPVNQSNLFFNFQVNNTTAGDISAFFFAILEEILSGTDWRTNAR